MFLAHSALEGWRVHGIDYSEEGLEVLEKFLESRNPAYGKFHQADIFNFDWSSIQNTSDIMISFGFLEHFTDPGSILSAATTALKPGGLVISQIPNLYSFNAKLMKKYAPELWRQHVPHSTEDFDRFHARAGLEILEPAFFAGGYDEQMLIPWGGNKKDNANGCIQIAQVFLLLCILPADELSTRERRSNIQSKYLWCLSQTAITTCMLSNVRN